MSLPLRFVALAAVLVALGVSLTTRPVQAHSRTPPCESFGLRGVHAMNAQNSVQWKTGGSELLFIHHDQLYQATADGTRVQGTFEVPYEAHIESRSYIKVYLSHADVSPDGTRVAYSVCWDSFTFWDSPPREPPDEESRAVDAPISTVFFEVAVWDATTDEVDYLAVGSVPVWSPDGTRIAFLSDYNYADPPADSRARVEADPGLFSMAADGSDIQRLAPADHGDIGLPPRWSPDGQLLAFVRGVGSAEQAVYTVGADGSDLTQISAAASLPLWSPDGARLALALPDGDEVALYTIASDGSDPRRLTTIEGWQSQGWNEGSYAEDPSVAWIDTVAWSPDGSKILYTCAWASVCVIDLDGNLVGTSPENLGEPHGPAWSPDGSRIAIGVGAEVDPYSRSVPEVLYTMRPDGSDLQVLVTLGVGLVAESVREADLATRYAACTARYVVPEPGANPGLVRDCQTLMNLRDWLFGGVTTNWNAGTPIDEWVGLTIEGSPRRVTGLRVGSGKYGDAVTAGVIPPDVANLPKLRTLELAGNQISGNIPPELGQLAELETLDVAHNQLSGLIPAELGDLSSLRRLNLSGNRLYGEIPPELGQLTSLELLDLAGNDLTGEIPEELGDLSSLQQLLLRENEFGGRIPGEIGQLSGLVVLDLAESGVAGSIPPEVGDLAGLETLDLSSNELMGDIPPELGGLRNLTELNLSQNHLTGLIPWELGWLTKLTDLQFGGNQLTGRVPVVVGSMYDLRSLGLWGNQLEECLPFHLNRREPPYISPREWATCEAGSYAFNIRDDALAGASVGRVYIPGRLEDTVSYVIAGGNEAGAFAIDSRSGRITVVGELDASAVDTYALTVAASDGIGDLVHVEIRVNPAPAPPTCASGIAVPNPEDNPGLVNDCRILLEARKVLVGRSWLNWSAEAPMEQWEAIELGGTPRRVLALEIRGPHGGRRIPPELGGLSALRRLVLFNNRLWGTIPSELGQLRELRELDLSNNAFSEAIPPELGQLANLTHLNLFVNRLTGQVPAELGQLTNLRELHLGLNHYLTQCLPRSLAARAQQGATLPDWPTCKDVD
ncbi:MAG: leucine-rich repeat domain-containing protein [Chloroflexota bacterium]|nr:leucine-rich repeat domain-containing protein [Chloroflexota bacterium]